MGTISVSLRVLSAAALAVATTAMSAEAQGRFRGMARLGAEMGGERVVEFQYADGSTPDVTAGGGLLVTAGVAAALVNSLEAQVNVGWKYRTIPKASNQEASWSRFPVEGLLFYRLPIGLRLGGGTAVHLNNVLSASGDALDTRLEFRNTPAFLVQAEYAMRNFAIDVRYTAMKYELSSGGSGSVQANSIGAGFSILFGQ